MHFLVTAGPTREYIDSVRFLSNPSSAKMGFALADIAAQRGHRVSLISGPTQRQVPPGVQLSKTTSARETCDRAFEIFPDCDCLIMAAAVSDYTPANPVKGKIKKTPGNISIEFTRTTDILAALSRDKNGKVLVGFALEVEDALKSARAKLESKNLDLVVLNGPASFESDEISATIMDKEGLVEQLQGARKEDLAAVVIARAEDIYRLREGEML